MNTFVEAWYSWLIQQDQRFLSTAVLGLALYTGMRVSEWAVQRALSDERRRYTVRKVIRYTAAGVFGLSVVEIWVQWLQGLLLILGATSAGLAIALAPVIVSIAGWLLITSSNLYKVGDRIQLGGVIGDVTDVGVLRTSLLEIGNWVGADQLSGRVVTVTNAAVFKDPVFNYTQGAPYVLKALAHQGIEIASPALTLMKYPAERTWKEQA